mmetsp:Transcript_24517/g.31990  ORF Transcript_24517/g.31990 Transcript_24517/m.31990 type:complete len:208 (-) Transcript_24517:22-645(-)
MGGATLNDKSGSGPHGKTAIGNFLCLEAFKGSGITVAESKRIKTKVTGGTFSRFASRGGGNTGNHFRNGDHNQTKGDVLGMGTPKLPEGIRLAFVGGHFTSRCGSEDLNLEESSNGHHGNTCMLDFSFTEPVKINTNFINVGKTKGIETNITSHGTIKERRSGQERKRLALFSSKGGCNTTIASRSKGGSRSSKESKGSGTLHHFLG